MKLLLDQGLPRSASALLRNAGWDVVHVAEIGMSSARDIEIMEAAKAQGRTVVTLDADFHSLIALHGLQMPSVVRIRIEGLRAENLEALLLRIFPTIAEELLHGAMVTITEQSVRCKLLRSAG